MSSVSIDGTTLASLGFEVQRVSGHMATGKPKKQIEGDEEYSSENYFEEKYYEESPEITIEFFGEFLSVPTAEAALFELYGLLVQPGSHELVHSNGANSITVDVIWHDGAKVKAQRTKTTQMVYSVTLKLLKADG